MSITPTGQLVYDGEPHTDDWYAVRREGITATDLPKILGLSKYGNALSVWRDKRGEHVDEAGEAAYWGTKQEPIVAERWSNLNEATVSKVGVIANSNDPWMVASLDRLVSICPDGVMGCGLEIKTRNAYVAGKWRDDVPDDVLAQVQWGLMVTGLPHMHVACLLGGQRLVQYTVARDKKLEDYLRKVAEPIWECVQTGVQPEVAADASGVLLAELNQMFADRAGSVKVDPVKGSRLVEQYESGGDLEEAGKVRKLLAKTEMIKMMGGAEVALGINNQPWWTYKRPQQSDEMTAKKLAKLKKDCPELYAEMVAEGYITKTSNKPRFNLK